MGRPLKAFDSASSRVPDRKEYGAEQRPGVSAGLASRRPQDPQAAPSVGSSAEDDGGSRQGGDMTAVEAMRSWRAGSEPLWLPHMLQAVHHGDGRWVADWAAEGGIEVGMPVSCLGKSLALVQYLLLGVVIFPCEDRAAWRGD